MSWLGAGLRFKQKQEKICGERADRRDSVADVRRAIWKMYGEYLANIRKPYPKEMVEAARKEKKESQ